MKTGIIRLTTLASAVTAPLAFAHPGHDHSHWLSDPIHLLSMLAISALVAAGYTTYRVRKSSKKALQQENRKG